MIVTLGCHAIFVGHSAAHHQQPLVVIHLGPRRILSDGIGVPLAFGSRVVDWLARTVTKPMLDQYCSFVVRLKFELE